jgi:hypothetical protein
MISEIEEIFVVTKHVSDQKEMSEEKLQLLRGNMDADPCN